MHTTLIPAYGRDYQTEAEVRTAWKAGKDFIIYTIGHAFDGAAINKFDAESVGGVFNIRYKQKTEVCVIKTASHAKT
jgi:hypothetical protein